MTLLATFAGAAIALVGQHISRRGEARTRGGELLLEQCAQVVGLAEDFRNRVWEEKELGLAGRVDAWDLSTDRHASARLRILCDDAALLRALDDLYEAGNRLGTYWRRGAADPAEFETHWEQYKASCATFVAASASVVRERLGNT
jgi:hypothetical protein